MQARNYWHQNEIEASYHNLLEQLSLETHDAVPFSNSLYSLYEESIHLR